MTVAELTTDAIDAMPAGREMDVLIAERVMGFPGAAVGGWTNPKIGDPQPYSTDIAAAWTVLEKLRSDGFDIEVSATEVEDKYTPGWTVEFDHDRSPYRTYTKHPNAWKVETATLAICRAALKTTLSFVERSSSI